jgi:CRP-like cAMP-binding protein
MITEMTGDDLAAVALFEGLGSNALDQIAATMAKSLVRPGITLAKQGERGFGFAVILSGNADVMKDGDRIATLGPGDIFGEMALESGSARNADVVATSQMVLANMMIWDYRTMVETHREIRERIDRIVGERS